MSELKTKENDASVTDFIEAVPDETKRQDSYRLLDMYKRGDRRGTQDVGRRNHRFREVPLQVRAEYSGG
jgi:hypothetical protein